MNSEFSLHVINSMVGETIVMDFGAERFGVIDTYESDNLKRFGSIVPSTARIELVALTHPHFDHYKGMAALINKRSDHIAKFWRYPGTSKKEVMAKYLSRQLSQGGIKEDCWLKAARREFEQLAFALKTHADKWGNNYQVVATPKVTQLAKVENCTLSAIAPLQGVVDNFEDFLKDPEKPFQDQGTSSENLVSCFYMLDFHGWILLFLSDIVNQDVWQNILHCLQTEFDPEKIVYAKCSHHGSDTGFYRPFLEWVGKLDHLTITAYSRSSLPKHDWVEQYSQYANTVALVSGEYCKRNPHAKSYDHVTLDDDGKNCDHIIVDATGMLRSKLIKV